MLQNSDIFYSASNRHDDFIPKNSHLLGDAAYPLKTWIMTPYKDNGHLTEQQKTYNFYLHSLARMVIERAFALLKGRFRRVKYVDIDKVDVMLVEGRLFDCLCAKAHSLHNELLARVIC